MSPVAAEPAGLLRQSAVLFLFVRVLFFCLFLPASGQLACQHKKKKRTISVIRHLVSVVLYFLCWLVGVLSSISVIVFHHGIGRCCNHQVTTSLVIFFLREISTESFQVTSYANGKFYRHLKIRSFFFPSKTNRQSKLFSKYLRNLIEYWKIDLH